MRKPDLCCTYPEHISPLVEGMRLTPEHSRRAWQRKVVRAPVLAHWLLNCPHVHPAWSYWIVSLIHLRPTEGLPTPHRLRPEFEYEIMALAVDPAQLPDPDAKEIIILRGAPSIRNQFGGTTDTEAIEIAESCILACIGNHLSPDEVWQRRWDRFVSGYVHALGAKGVMRENMI